MGRKQTRRRKHFYFCLAGLMFLSLWGCATSEKIKIETNPQEEAKQHLRRGQDLLSQKDFEGALNANQEILVLTTHQPPEDEALFYIGMIFAHPEYSGRDAAKSLYFFSRVTEAYPKSLWAVQARAWVKMLQQNQRLNQRLNQLDSQVVQCRQEKIKAAAQEREARQPFLNSRELLSREKYEEAFKEIQKILTASPRQSLEDEALFQAGLIYAHPANPKRDFAKAITFFKKLMKDHPQSPWTELAKDWTGMLRENDRLNQAVEKLNQTIEKSKQVDIEIEEKRREKGK
jgi:tetratricopeptide (TPR) repeat protein